MFNPIEEEFLAEFDKIERLCVSLFEIECYGVECYLDKLEKCFSFAVDDDITFCNEYHRLKEICQKRIDLLQESEVATDNMQNDIEWLHDFRHKILDETDVLAVMERVQFEQRQAKREEEHELFMGFQMEQSPKNSDEVTIKRRHREQPRMNYIEAYKAKPPKERMELLIAGLVVGFIVIGLVVYAVMQR